MSNSFEEETNESSSKSDSNSSNSESESESDCDEIPQKLSLKLVLPNTLLMFPKIRYSICLRKKIRIVGRICLMYLFILHVV